MPALSKIHLNQLTEDDLKQMDEKKLLTESLYAGDLRHLISDTVTIDEFKSKMGDDKDVIVVSIFVTDREPAQDLNNFIEKGYSFILDADVSPGEMDDGKYVVFVEFDRSDTFPEELIQILKDVEKLSNIKRWHFKYFKFNTKQEVTRENLIQLPLNKEEYLEISKVDNPNEHDPRLAHEYEKDGGVMPPMESINRELNAMRAIARIPISHHQPKITDPALLAMQRIARIPGK